ncbi:ATP-grasp domain-containing protein [Flagellimonas oceanensis]|uniref:ATP-grasp domain-containing protein n=1 Tax=Flagellimonas oceanensis TaxID=2499163 RepID=UPI000F8CEAB8|nr:ATP-grasp domain-containing protein [Allomuricauda oceanensis]
MNILITSAGRRVSLLQAFQKELKKITPDGKVYAADANPILSAACRVSDDFFMVPRLDDESYVSTLIENCKQRNIGLVVPTIDHELMLLAENKERFLENGITVLVSKPDFVKKCRNKKVTHEYFESMGVSVAKEFKKDDYQLPLFIKPIDGSRSVDTFIIKSKEELTNYHFENDKLLFLEYLDHQDHDEYTCDLYYNKQHELKCIVPRKRIEVRDGEVNKGVTCRNELVDHLKEKLSFMDGAVGCITAQFFMHKESNQIYGIELNARFGGGYPLSYLAGANFPKWIFEEYYQKKELADQFDVWEDNLLMLRYDNEVLVHGYKG